jgi:predicted HTH transcriptional regulator
VEELCKYPDELPWVEFKHNNYDPQMIGKDISALSNSATLHDKDCAYMIWGVNDKTHEIIGTKNNLQNLKVGNQELENWLRSLLSKNVYFEFHSVIVNNNNVCVLIIYKAINHTVMFENIDYIRIGSYTKKLNQHPEIQAQLWDKIRNSTFEERFAKTDLSLGEALKYLDCNAYFELKDVPYPSDINGVGYYMIEEGIIFKQDNNLFAITNMGAILFAKKLSDFNRIARKAFRIV